VVTTIQRRQGHLVEIWPITTVTDDRGHAILVPDQAGAVRVRAVMIPDRSGPMEVPGQGHIHIVKMLTSHEVPGLTTGARVLWNDMAWDVIMPPEKHYGPRATRHLTTTLRERTSRG
jgi:hypothetical protein